MIINSVLSLIFIKLSPFFEVIFALTISLPSPKIFLPNKIPSFRIFPLILVAAIALPLPPITPELMMLLFKLSAIDIPFPENSISS
ncbi:MAG: hypothetical protein ACRDA0_00645 [Cetobacterium sp.]|uniref:hypothetical protein n=1 Tax=Cetobacterium sp. TaxID=2071632 RepID=UPI003F32E471